MELSFSTNVYGAPALDYFAIGDSGVTGLVPVHAISFLANASILKGVAPGRFLYAKPRLPEPRTFSRNDQSLENIVRENAFLTPWKYASGGKDRYVMACRGYACDAGGNILMVFCSPGCGKGLFTADFRTNATKLSLFVSHALMNDPLFGPVRARLRKHFIAPAHALGTPVTYDGHKAIERAVYANAHRIAFRDLDELEQKLKGEPRQLLLGIQQERCRQRYQAHLDAGLDEDEEEGEDVA